MNSKEEIKYYVSSKGEKTPIKDVEFTHLSNGLAKKYRDVFESKTKDEYFDKINEINDIKEEIYRRLNDFESKIEK